MSTVRLSLLLPVLFLIPESAQTAKPLVFRGKEAIPVLLSAQREEWRDRAVASSGGSDVEIRRLIEGLRNKETATEATAALALMGAEGMGALRQTFAGVGNELRITILKGGVRAGRTSFPLVLDGLRHPEAEVRTAAAAALENCPAALDAIEPQLLELLADPNEKTRYQVVNVLDQIVPPRREIVLILARVLVNNDGKVSQVAASRLESLGRHARAAVPQVLQALTHNESIIRARAATILGTVGWVRRDIVLALCASLRDTDAAVREAAAEALQRVGPATRCIVDEVPAPIDGIVRREIVLPALRRCLSDKKQSVRVAAASTCVCLGDRSADLARQLGLDALDPLTQAGHRDNCVRMQAIWAIRQMGNAGLPAIPFVVPILQEDHEHLSAGVVELLASLGPAAREAIPALQKTLLAHPDPFFTPRVARALARLGPEGQNVLKLSLCLPDETLTYAILDGLRQAGPEAKPLFPSALRFVRSKDGSWDDEALRTVWSIGGHSKAVRLLLLRVMESHAPRAAQTWRSLFRSREARRVAILGLGEMGADALEAVPTLLADLLNSESETRSLTLGALGQIAPNDRRVLAALVKKLTDPDWSVRKAAVEALGGAGRPALNALQSACRDGSDRVRIAAACALYRIQCKQDEASRVLRSVMLDGEDGFCCVQACNALWKHEHTREVVPVLAHLLRHDDALVCSAAVEALCKLDGAQDDVRAFLRPMLKHELRTVRAAAWQVLEKTSPELTTALVNAR